MLTYSRKLSLAVLLAALVFGCATPVRKSEDQALELTKAGILEEKITSGLVLIDHEVFKIHYDPSIRLARMVYYSISKKDLVPTSVKRRDKFIPDPILISKSIPYVSPSEYKKTGYDQGHLAPSDDFIRTQKENDLTFVMSNMAPQLPRLNRDSWRLLELKVRGWACGEELIDVYTGPILGSSKKTLPKGLVIPQKFFKVVVDRSPPYKSVGFVFDQSDSKADASERVVDIKTIESITGLKILNQKQSKYPQTTDLTNWKEVKCY